MRGVLSILYLFQNEFNQFTNTGVWMFDYIYHHMTLIVIKITFFDMKMLRISDLLRNVIIDVTTLRY